LQEIKGLDEVKEYSLFSSSSLLMSKLISVESMDSALFGSVSKHWFYGGIIR
jgi:hypothetical protein